MPVKGETVESGADTFVPCRDSFFVGVLGALVLITDGGVVLKNSPYMFFQYDVAFE